MNETRPIDYVEPRFELEPGLSPRLEPAEPIPPAETKSINSAQLAATGTAVLILGLAVLEVANFAAAQFERSLLLGLLTVAVALAGFGLIGAALWRELRGLVSLHHVDRLRLALGDPATAPAAAREWLATLPEGAALLPAVGAAGSPETLAAVLRNGPAATLRKQSEALGYNAAVQMFLVNAMLPAPALDGLVMLWRGARLVRQVAELHGLRPGLLGTVALLRRVLFGAGAVVATDLTANALLSAAVNHPMLRHIGGDLAGGGVAARRMVMLARATATACTPLPPP